MKILILFIFVSLISKNLSAYQEISIQKDNSLMNYEDILNSISSSIAKEDIREFIDKNIYNINFSSDIVSFELDFQNLSEELYGQNINFNLPISTFWCIVMHDFVSTNKTINSKKYAYATTKSNWQ